MEMQILDAQIAKQEQHQAVEQVVVIIVDQENIHQVTKQEVVQLV